MHWSWYNTDNEKLPSTQQSLNTIAITFTTFNIIIRYFYHSQDGRNIFLKVWDARKYSNVIWKHLFTIRRRKKFTWKALEYVWTKRLLQKKSLSSTFEMIFCLKKPCFINIICILYVEATLFYVSIEEMS